MFKVIKAEINKMLSKPGAFVLAILLAAILVLGVFVYKPIESANNNITVQGETFTTKYSNFMDIAKGDKNVADTSLAKATNAILSYTQETINGTVSQKEYINSFKEQFDKQFKNYEDCVVLKKEGSTLQVQKSFNELVNAIDVAIINNANDCYALLSTKSNREEFVAISKEIKNHFSLTPSNHEEAQIQCAKYEKEYKPILEKCLNNLIYPTLSQEFVTTYTENTKNSQFAILQDRLNTILIEMQTLNTEANKNQNNSNSLLAKEMDRLANEYVKTIQTYTNLIHYELIVNAYDNISTTDQLDVLNLSSSKFESNSLKIRYEFLFNNNSYDSDYAHPLTIGVSSNSNPNAYDYAYFVLKLFSFVIIFYAIMSTCFTISGETKDGTMRYFAIRPISRTEILLGKMFAILLLTTIFIIFSSIIALLVGGIVFGFNSLNILAIFNSSNAFIAHPLAILSIYLLSMLIKVIIYCSIAMLLSNLIKSDLLAVTIVIVFTLVNTLLPVFITGPNTWLTFYPFSHIDLYALFGSSIYLVNNNFFSILLGSKVFAGTNLILTLSIIIITILICTLLSIKIFKKKEL